MTSHIIDPTGEVTIILQDADAPFAVWDEETPATNESPSSGTIEPIEEIHNDKTDETKCEDKEVRYQVSAKHLTLASPVFKAALSDAWKEGSTLPQGSAEIEVHGWDSQALLVMLSILHWQIDALPGKVGIEFLTKIVILADYYGCLSVIKVFGWGWFKLMQSSIPNEYSRDLMMWLCASGLLGEREVYERLAVIAIKGSKDIIMTLGLPFPSSMIEHLNTNRERVIQGIVDSLHSAVDSLARFNSNNAAPSTPSDSCTACNAIKLGTLMMAMRSLSLWPKPQPPFCGLSFGGIRASIKSTREKEFKLQNHGRCRSLATMLTYLDTSSWSRMNQSIKAD
ncbi:hypothetical protein P170DRAFT_482554 [Aspergillus steynii IBT 23096]|uniref:BTB domain-containing protein n=1 Tax=Aspergillus steynii IBT 23096 TaxID=1392250 RepID=A0A2I2GML8_9EURO|nr:uncharacterized protein P170DRAFT_482554 [Aspergillus steynii IBT 23096]PLB54141.1 hypothetical protein P170DRAFT_482554 [Aspergillus steynii IBT 23096]